VHEHLYLTEDEADGVFTVFAPIERCPI